jgi:hypothetical protein
MGNLPDEVRWAVEQICIIAERLARALEEEPEILWAYPVGTLEHPPEDFYAACVHDPTGKANKGYGHTGVDLNLDRSPWGDVDRGMPVYTVAPGTVRAASYSSSYLGSIIIESQYNAQPLFWRYWHLADDTVFRSIVMGQMMAAGQQVGAIGNYTLGEGGDHCHVDCALDLFGAHWWFTRHPEIRWIDPVPTWLQNLDPVRVAAMLRRGD